MNPRDVVNYLDDYQRVSAHLPDRAGTVVVGVLLPYDANLDEERVKDDNGVVWGVVASSVRVCEEAS